MPEKTEKRTRKKRLPLEAEQQLWNEVTKDVKPLTKQLPKLTQSMETDEDLPTVRVNKLSLNKGKLQYKPLETTDEPRMKERVTKAASEKQAQSSHQMSAAQRKKLSKGELGIDGRIDLHGMTAATAHRRVVAFIEDHIQRASRCLLVITGKGEESGGILRMSLPLWLDTPALRPFILSVSVAANRHGGHGAFYVMLRRRRSV